MSAPPLVPRTTARAVIASAPTVRSAIVFAEPRRAPTWRFAYVNTRENRPPPSATTAGLPASWRSYSGWAWRPTAAASPWPLRPVGPRSRGPSGFWVHGPPVSQDQGAEGPQARSPEVPGAFGSLKPLGGMHGQAGEGSCWRGAARFAEQSPSRRDVTSSAGESCARPAQRRRARRRSRSCGARQTEQPDGT